MGFPIAVPDVAGQLLDVSRGSADGADGAPWSIKYRVTTLCRFFRRRNPERFTKSNQGAGSRSRCPYRDRVRDPAYQK